MRAVIRAILISCFFASIARADTPDGTTTLTEGTVTFQLITRSNHQTLVVTDIAAKLNFEGAFTTEAERAKTPPDILDAYRLAGLHKELNFWDGSEWEIVGHRIARILKLQRWLSTDNPNADPEILGLLAKSDPEDPLPPILVVMIADIHSRVPDADIKEVMTAYRDARHKVEAELERAQDDLKKVVTVRQELILIRMGFLR
jgi:hypothetical protein